MKILTWFNERELDTLSQEDRETLMTAVHGVEEIPAPPEKEEELAGALLCTMNFSLSPSCLR